MNAGAMTDVDAAHLDPERALQVVELAPGVLAGAAQEVGARVVVPVRLCTTDQPIAVYRG